MFQHKNSFLSSTIKSQLSGKLGSPKESLGRVGILITALQAERQEHFQQQENGREKKFLVQVTGGGARTGMSFGFSPSQPSPGEKREPWGV